MLIYSPGPIQFLFIQFLLRRSVLSYHFPGVSEDLAEKSRDKKDAGPEPIKPCPGQELFCEDADDYPTAYEVNENVAAASLVRNTIFQTNSDVGKNVSDLLTRFDSTLVKESRACDHRKSSVYPKKAKNVDGAFVFIVNDEQYRQAVDIEQCLGEGEPCRVDEDAPSFGATVCRQKYATYKMYVINQEGEQVYDSFSLPSACLCHHKSNFAIRIQSEVNIDLPVCPTAEPLSIPQTPGPAEQQAIRTTKSTVVKFQDRKRRQTGFVFEPQQCTSASQNNYCETEENYPKNVVLKVIQSNKELSADLFQQLYDSKCKDPIQTRGFNIDEEQLCNGIPKIIFPRKAKNLDEKWRYVVNIDNYTQSVEIEECHNFNYNEELPAQNGSVLFGEEKEPVDFGVCLYSGAEGNNPDMTTCKQIYTEHKLLALSEDGQLLVDSFKLPSACACFLREDLNLEFRQGEITAEEEREANTEAPPLPPQVEKDEDEEQFIFG